MFAPNATTHQLADQIHHERQSHAERMQLVAREKGPDGAPLDRYAQRRITARRLAAGAVALALTVTVAAVTVAGGASGGPGGGGVTLIR